MRQASTQLISMVVISVALAAAQAGPSSQGDNSAPVSYSSVTQLNDVLGGLEQASQTTQLDLAKLRIEKWKTDAANKRQTDGDVQSIQRNLQSAMPQIVAQLKSSPESLADTFKLYRNLDALFDVFSSVVESAGAFGSKDEFQSLQNDLNAMERSRHAVADRMESLSSAKENELGQLRSQLRTAQAAISAAPPKKVVVDDTQPAKKPAKKKSSAKTTRPAAAPASDMPPQPPQ